MEIIRTVAEMRAWRRQAGKLAFVPTMGNLHAGHLALVKAARERADKVAVSIFVNRLQFGQGEDFGAYPRTFDADCDKLRAAGVDALFFPDEQELYPRVRQDFNVEPPNIQNELCGAFRPGHFRGVATVVTKLFNIVQPDLACFGKKDFQQLHVIRAMVDDLNSPIEIVPVDTGRADDGLALSSRNGYLSAEERAEAPRLYRNLTRLQQRLQDGDNDYAALEQGARDDLAQAGWTVDYVEIRQADTLAVAHAGEKRLVVLAAARLGRTRLIDNIEVFR
ncbi:pantoate--beta-alanine ligase [Chromobacterium alkanivorans]|uniref:pantoate--beta-alanine ligase n=1 Tax=Chromobacterium alkanivorans TaxID=1071719 RepID=UPI0021685336|nr:pantoate--beta-alanine ligase [Chromobacterium alkanivorans]MCS3804127.1 pantoate--beta-alanine ligase [Chromobacterium alkanivorans]MCS3818652.1 pantoate--beta-alanine ligase [Chromobacterium alkanivorans]MCS3873413.1 pantoate--beta-alanine ligase [Chromobacterium alkanivorans]